jgi:hypothetical protein
MRSDSGLGWAVLLALQVILYVKVLKPLMHEVNSNVLAFALMLLLSVGQIRRR